MNFIERYIDYASEFCDAPLKFHKYVAFSILSTVVGRKIWIQKGDAKFFPNLWILLISPSSKFHRSTSINIGKNILQKLEGINIYANDFSREGFIKLLQNQPQGLFRIDEFGGFLKTLDREYQSGLKELITELYENPSYYKRFLSGNIVELKDICFTILAGSNLKWIQNSLKDSDILGGFLPRFIIVPAEKKEKIIPFQPPASSTKQFSLLQELSRIRRIEGEFHLPEITKSIYSNWYISFQQQFHSETFDGFCIRLLDYALKFALLFEVQNENQDYFISPESMTFAIELIEEITKGLLLIGENLVGFSRKDFASAKQKVFSIIAQHPEGISRGYLLHQTDLKAKELSEILDVLLEAELIVSERVRIDGAKKSTVILKKNSLFSPDSL